MQSAPELLNFDLVLESRYFELLSPKTEVVNNQMIVFPENRLTSLTIASVLIFLKSEISRTHPGWIRGQWLQLLLFLFTNEIR